LRKLPPERHWGRLLVGVFVCVVIAAVALFMFVSDLIPEAKGVDDLGEARESEIEGLPIPVEANLLDGEFGTVEPGDGILNGRVYDFPSGFSTSEVERWYRRLDGLAEQNWHELWVWCPAPVTETGVHYFWVSNEFQAVLSLEVERDDRTDSPASGDVVVSLLNRDLASVPDEERPAC
jgi:hypothetical protein